MRASLRIVGILLLGSLLAGGIPSAVLGQTPNNPLREAGEPATDTEPEAPTETRSAATSRPSRQVDEAVQPASRVTRRAPRRGPVGRVRPAAYRLFGQRRVTTLPGSTPHPTSVLSERTIIADEVLQDGAIEEIQPGELPSEIIFDGASGCCDGGGCHECWLSCPKIPLENLELSAGVHGFTGPKNRGSTGSFGFHEGFNWGAPVPCTHGCLGMQVGVDVVHSNFSGAVNTDDDRHQIFLTTGLFRRVDWGLQGGVVFDYLSDEWYTDTDLTQVRGEISWVYPCRHELGFWFASSTKSETAVSAFLPPTASVSETWEPMDLYAFFYRHRFEASEGATARLYAGFSGDSDGLIGADLRFPLSNNWALEAEFTYLVPEEAKTGLTGGGHESESWNVAVGVAWYPGIGAACSNDYFRPLFNVANNGTFMVDRR